MRPVNYTGVDFDHFVRVLIGRWEDAIDRQKRWRSFDGEERALYTEDWPVNNDIHQHLADYAAAYELTEDQKAQWTKLNRLVAEHARGLKRRGYRVRLPETANGRAVA